MEFRNGLKQCYQLLKNKGYLVVIEAVLLSSDIPKQLKKFWDEGYPDIKDIKSNILLIQNEGYNLLTHFTLQKSTWADNYYSPMEKRIKALKKKYHDNTIALHVFEECEKEIKMYHTYSDITVINFLLCRRKKKLLVSSHFLLNKNFR